MSIVNTLALESNRQIKINLPIVLFQIKRLKTCKNRKESLFF